MGDKALPHDGRPRQWKNRTHAFRDIDNIVPALREIASSSNPRPGYLHAVLRQLIEEAPKERREVPNDAPLRSEHEPLSTRGRVAGAVRVSLLGSFRISVGAHVVEESAWQLRKAASLVKLLSLAPAHHLHRGQVMEILWPGCGRQAAAHNLRQALHVARRTLEFNSSTPHYLVSHSEHLVLCPDGLLWVDVEAFEEAAASARRSREPRAYRVAIGLYAGQLLPGDLYEEWAGDRRRELQGLYLALLTELAGLYEESGELEAAVEVLQKVIAEEATREEANAELMRLYALLRRRGEALSQYERLREALRRELGVEPDATTNRLRNEILTGTFKPDHSQPQPHSCREPMDAGKHNLPSVSTNFVGREREMREVELALAMTRFLTLTGAGGSGKTRLALEVARDLVGAYPDGVWLVELAGLSEPSAGAASRGYHTWSTRAAGSTPSRHTAPRLARQRDAACVRQLRASNRGRRAPCGGPPRLLSAPASASHQPGAPGS